MTISGNVGNGKNTLGVGLIRVLYKFGCIHRVNFETFCPYCDKYGITDSDRELVTYSNFDLWLDEDPALPRLKCNFLRNVNDYVNMPKSKKHSICMLDEPNTWGFDARASMSKENREIGYVMQHTRHNNRDQIILTQFWSQFDLRGRRLSSDTILAVEPDSRLFYYGLFKYDEIIPISMKKAYARQKIFPYYDTSQIIAQSEEINNEVSDNSEVYSA